MMYYQTLDGCPLISSIQSVNTQDHDDKFPDKTYPWEYEYVCIKGTDPEDIISIRFAAGPFKKLNNKEIKNIIPMSSAMEMLNKKLAGYKEYNLVDVGISYLMIDDGINYDDSDMSADDKEILADSEKAGFFGKAYCKYKYRPYWTFYFNQQLNAEILGYVDCEKGDVVFVNNQ
ncbi:MAG: hypothetical protein VZR00_00005 [Lachnospiraceae bacterium]|nr:hypothetical protein [Lachnospiraceae bacterium]MEE3460264.1 hypothetical protein [Lachnospiraceae bacterium]